MKIIITLVLLSLSICLCAQQSVDINQSLQLSAEFIDDTSLKISWPAKEDATGYTISTRLGSFIAFSAPVVIMDSAATSYVLEDLNPILERLDVKVIKLGGSQSSGYIMAGREYSNPYIYKKTLLVVEENLYGQITTELEAYISTLKNELWGVETITVQSTESVQEVKQKIKDKHEEAPFSHMILLGHVPVPYSGNNAIDGHTSGNNHRGAWVCDAYYGNLNGVWTDSAVNNEEATRDANKNIPGDGKFDQNFIPSRMNISIGRIDLVTLPAFDDDEIALTKKYLLKNIDYRTGEIKATRRGLVDNNFGLGEGFGQGAIKSFATFFPLDSTHYENYSTLKTKDYLWSFGAGGGSYQSASGIINTNQLATDSIQSIFTTIFGSYFGDWDNANNLLRSSIASGSTLINAWSGRPIWQFHYLAMGETIGDILLATQNNNGDYFSQFGNRLTHISLIGDPTLKMYYYRAAEDFTVTLDSTNLNLAWESSPDDVLGYNIYKSIESGEYQKVNNEIVSGNDFIIECPSDGDSVLYTLRPVVLEASPSGSYYNEGAGISTILMEGLEEPFATFSFMSDGGPQVIFNNESTGADSYLWDFGDGNSSELENPTHTYSENGTYTIVLIAGNQCQLDTLINFYTVSTVSTIENENKYEIYPNPTTSRVLILGLEKKQPYTIFDISGRKYTSGNIDISNPEIDFNLMLTGIYYLKIGGNYQIIHKE